MGTEFTHNAEENVNYWDMGEKNEMDDVEVDTVIRNLLIESRLQRKKKPQSDQK